MNHFLSVLLASFFLLSGALHAKEPTGSAYIDGLNNKRALILLHGKGGHPRSEVVDSLRTGVNEKLGLHTLSLRLPNKNKKMEKYAEDFPKSYDIIKDGIRFLKEEKGVTTIYLAGYDLGARMATAFVADNPGQPIAGLIVIECGNDGGYPFSCKENLEKARIPVLDLWLKEDNKSSDSASERKNLRSSTYHQKAIPCRKCIEKGGKSGNILYERKLTGNSIKWLKSQF
jgi:pimeloyl-ACP methyl ester carboxylesterase